MILMLQGTWGNSGQSLRWNSQRRHWFVRKASSFSVRHLFICACALPGTGLGLVGAERCLNVPLSVGSCRALCSGPTLPSRTQPRPGDSYCTARTVRFTLHQEAFLDSQAKTEGSCYAFSGFTPC